MALFDSAIFDSAIFDTGDETPRSRKGRKNDYRPTTYFSASRSIRSR